MIAFVTSSDSRSARVLTKQRPGMVSWLLQACCQPGVTPWVQSSAGKGNLTEGMGDNSQPGNAGWQVCVCECVYVLAGGSKWEMMVVQTVTGRWAGLRHDLEDTHRKLNVYDALHRSLQTQETNQLECHHYHGWQSASFGSWAARLQLNSKFTDVKAQGGVEDEEGATVFLPVACAGPNDTTCRNQKAMSSSG